MNSRKNSDAYRVEQLEQRLLFAYSLSPNPATVNENAGSVSFTLTRTGTFPAETLYASTTQSGSPPKPLPAG